MTSRNLATRILVAVIAGPIIIWIAYRGGWWLLGMITLFALIAISEFLVNEGFSPKGGIFWLGLIATMLLLLIIADSDAASLISDSLVPNSVVHLGLGVVVLFYAVSAMAFAIGRRSPEELFRRHSCLVWGVLYVGLLYPLVYLVGGGYAGISGGDCLLFLLGILWVGDTAAMGIGKWLGRRKLAPGVSPRKTVEGLIGGLIGAAAVGVLMYVWKFGSLSFVEVMVLAVGCSLFGQLGDLVESMWKRSLGIKDSSTIIPGHGGVLDRFDSLLFAAPFMYAFFRVWQP